MNADWTQIPIGVGVAALLMREMSRFLHERQQEGKNDSSLDLKRNEESGSRSVDFWEAKMREIVYCELERHVLPWQRETKDKLSAIHDNVKELRWRKRNERSED